MGFRWCGARTACSDECGKSDAISLTFLEYPHQMIESFQLTYLFSMKRLLLCAKILSNDEMMRETPILGVFRLDAAVS